MLPASEHAGLWAQSHEHSELAEAGTTAGRNPVLASSHPTEAGSERLRPTRKLTISSWTDSLQSCTAVCTDSKEKQGNVWLGQKQLLSEAKLHASLSCWSQTTAKTLREVFEVLQQGTQKFFELLLKAGAAANPFSHENGSGDK